MIEHFKSAHEGPLIQYFKPSITLSLSIVEGFTENTCCVINYNSTVFFLKTCKLSEIDLLVWIWCLGDEKTAGEYECLVSVTDSKTKEILLSVANSIFSLSSVTWGEIKKKKRGVYLNSHVIKSLTSFPDSNIIFSIIITKKM